MAVHTAASLKDATQAYAVPPDTLLSSGGSGGTAYTCSACGRRARRFAMRQNRCRAFDSWQTALFAPLQFPPQTPITTPVGGEAPRVPSPHDPHAGGQPLTAIELGVSRLRRSAPSSLSVGAVPLLFGGIGHSRHVWPLWLIFRLSRRVLASRGWAGSFA